MEDLASHYKNLLAYAAKCTSNRSEDTMTINILETKRLILTVPQLSDLDNLIALRTDPEVMCCLGGFGQAPG